MRAIDVAATRRPPTPRTHQRPPQSIRAHTTYSRSAVLLYRSGGALQAALDAQDILDPQHLEGSRRSPKNC
jgi:hypothetical protein